jgi:hypothetical protein
VFGNVIEELKAPYDGVVIGFWSVPVIRPATGGTCLRKSWTIKGDLTSRMQINGCILK